MPAERSSRMSPGRLLICQSTLKIWDATIRRLSGSTVNPGKGGVAFVLERDFGLTLPRWVQVELAQSVQKASEQQAGEVTSRDIYRLFPGSLRA